MRIAEHPRENFRDAPQLSCAEQARVAEIQLQTNQAVFAVSPVSASAISDDFSNVLNSWIPMESFTGIVPESILQKDSKR